MENNLINMKVVLNHIEEKDFNNMHFYVYTFTDFECGHSFDCWVVERLSFIDDIKLLIDARIITFKVVIKKNGSIKLVPLYESSDEYSY